MQYTLVAGCIGRYRAVSGGSERYRAVSGGIGWYRAVSDDGDDDDDDDFCNTDWHSVVQTSTSSYRLVLCDAD